MLLFMMKSGEFQTSVHDDRLKYNINSHRSAKKKNLKDSKPTKLSYDFTVLVRIKERMVDLSSDCIEMALEGVSREGWGKKSGASRSRGLGEEAEGSREAVAGECRRGLGEEDSASRVVSGSRDVKKALSKL
ncbi:hypothetical protein Cni_G19395 [Canna indica]|uniref:Uncharacterized protein n=1 Tax=Canna indica TaxID=4628 RepID=A0AAQ3QIH4_9LILI|nr:hypothetical protein Cni_G19395 [Canna indica]